LLWAHIARHNRIKEFKAANAPCSEAEWEQILLAILVDPQGATHVQDIEIKVELRSDEEVTLHFRKNIQGIAVSSYCILSTQSMWIGLLICISPATPGHYQIERL